MKTPLAITALFFLIAHFSLYGMEVELLPNEQQDHLANYSLEELVEGLRRCSCGIRFNKFQELIDHIQQQHRRSPSINGAVQKFYSCSACSFAFFSLIQKFLIHIPEHTNEIIYTCPECKKDFSIFKKAKEHVEMHQDLQSQLDNSINYILEEDSNTYPLEGGNRREGTAIEVIARNESAIPSCAPQSALTVGQRRKGMINSVNDQKEVRASRGIISYVDNEDDNNRDTDEENEIASPANKRARIETILSRSLNEEEEEEEELIIAESESSDSQLEQSNELALQSIANKLLPITFIPLSKIAKPTRSTRVYKLYRTLLEKVYDLSNLYTSENFGLIFLYFLEKCCCEEYFDKPEMIGSHITNKHYSSQSNTYHCPCGNYSSGLATFMAHIYYHAYKRQTIQFGCIKCRKSLISHQDIRRHICNVHQVTEFENITLEGDDISEKAAIIAQSRAACDLENSKLFKKKYDLSPFYTEENFWLRYLSLLEICSCGEKFGEIETIWQHIEKEHYDPQLKRFECKSTNCDRSIGTFQKLLEFLIHLYRHAYALKMVEFSCNQCDTSLPCSDIKKHLLKNHKILLPKNLNFNETIICAKFDLAKIYESEDFWTEYLLGLKMCPCGETFTDKEKFTNKEMIYAHLKDRHWNSRIKKYCCVKDCNGARGYGFFKTLTDLLLHMYSHSYKENRVKLDCTLCRALSIGYKTIKKHILIRHKIALAPELEMEGE